MTPLLFSGRDTIISLLRKYMETSVTDSVAGIMTGSAVCTASTNVGWLVLPGAKSVFPKTVATELQTAQLAFTPV